MPPRSTVYRLDAAIRAELDGRIAAAGYGDYADHAAWLAEKGYALSQAAIQRYGKRLKALMDREFVRTAGAADAVIGRIRHAAEMAQAVNGIVGDDPLAMSERTAELCMARLYEIAAREEIEPKTLQAISKSLNDSLRTIAGARGQRSEDRRIALEEAKAKVVAVARERGLPADIAAALRKAITTVRE